jgi:threonine dehydrogenase-like Zn-dependent dehydrogenase
VLAGQLVEPGRFEVVEADPPVPAEGQVLLESQRTSICGSDLHLVYKGMYRGEHPAPPGWPGHEGVGTVLESRADDFGFPETLNTESTWSFSRAWAKRVSIEVVTGAQGEPGLVSFREAVRLIASGTVDTAPLAANVYPLASLQEAFEAARERRGPKISVECT